MSAWRPFQRWRKPAELTGLGPPLLAGRYQVGERIGHGGLSQVFDGTDMRHGRPVAIKFIALPAEPAAPGLRSEWRLRLQRELRLARRLRHPDIVALLDAGLLPQQGWMVMERIQGADLARYTRPERRLPDDLVFRIGARIGAALAHAHGRGVLHRDLKPANLLVDLATDQVKLADFGLAKAPGSGTLTRTGMTLGTPAYLAPEVLAGGGFTTATDAYALGVVLYELLASQRPHQAASLGALLQAVAHRPAAPLASHRPDLPAAARALVDALLAQSPAARPPDLGAWAAQMGQMAATMARALAPQTRTSSPKLSVASR